jgi:hypothetical protein
VLVIVMRGDGHQQQLLLLHQHQHQHHHHRHANVAAAVLWCRQAVALLEKMGARRLRPNLVSFNLAIVGCAR